MPNLVYEAAGKVEISMLRPTAVMALLRRPGLQHLAQEVEDTMIRIIDRCMPMTCPAATGRLPREFTLRVRAHRFSGTVRRGVGVQAGSAHLDKKPRPPTLSVQGGERVHALGCDARVASAKRVMSDLSCTAPAEER